MVVENVTATNFGRYSSISRYYCGRCNHIVDYRYFYEAFDTTASPTLESCVLGFFFNSLPATALFADTTNNKCYFGSAGTNSAILAPTDSPWTVYIKRSKLFSVLTVWETDESIKFNKYSADFTQYTGGDFATEELPSSDLTGSKWNKFVYRAYSGSNVDPHIQEACTAMCAFDQPTVDGTRCHFTTVSASTCYLGTLGEETNLLNNPTSTAFSLKTSKPQHQICSLSHKLCFSDALYMGGFRTAKFPYSTTTGISKQDLIFNKLAGIAYTEDTCASLCYTHSPSTPVCHFFILDGTACALGNYGGFNGTQHALTSPTLTAFYNESGSKWCHGGN